MGTAVADQADPRPAGDRTHAGGQWRGADAARIQCQWVFSVLEHRKRKDAEKVKGRLSNRTELSGILGQLFTVFINRSSIDGSADQLAPDRRPELYDLPVGGVAVLIEVE